MLYSTIAAQFADIFVKFLALTQNSILTIKTIKYQNKIYYEYYKIIRVMRIKIIIFLCFMFLVLLFCWYFISAFCAVYINTQIIAIKDCIGSFATSMVYPFGLYLIPSLLRMWALKDNKRNRKFLYWLSNIIPIL